MYRIGYVSCFDIFGMQEKLLREGHTLNLWFSNEPTEDGSGFEHKKYSGNLVDMNANLEDLVKISDFVFCDYYTPKSLIKNLFKLCKKYNTPLAGPPNEEHLKLELDRAYGKRVSSEYLGFSNVEVLTFTEPNDFVKYVHSCKHRFVVKAFNQDRADIATYIPFSNEDALYMAEEDCFHMFGSGGVFVEPYHDGYEVCMGAWFDGYSFNDAILLNQEYKGALEWNQGDVKTGEVGTVMKFMPMKRLPINMRRKMQALEEYLRTAFKTPYKGFIDVNTIITPKDIFLLEFTIRCGMPTELEVLEMVDSYGDLLAWESGYRDTFSGYDFDNTYVFGALTPYGIPYGLSKDVMNMKPKVLGLEGLTNPFIMMYAHYDEWGDVRHTMDERALLIYGKGKTFSKARKQYVEEAVKVSAWHSMVRRDIGSRWKPINSVIGA